MNKERRENILDTITLKDAIINTTFKPGRVYEGPDIIDLATLQQDAEELIDFTLTHPSKHEAARVVYIKPDNKVITNKNVIEGEHGHVLIGMRFFTPAIYTPIRRFSQDKFIGSVMHSHPVDQVFSPEDLSHLLAKDTTSDAGTSALLVTPKRKLLVFRGENTPKLDEKDLRLNIESMNQTLNYAYSSELINKIFMFQNPDNFQAEIARRFFRSLVSGYDLQVFEGNARDRYLHRVEANQIAE
jgi:hypothetical protein